MAVEKIFTGTENSGTDAYKIMVKNIFNHIYLEININTSNSIHMCLDKETALELVEELKKQISLLE